MNMASAMKKCRICGKAYEACRSANRTAVVFRWQEVACSPECGAMYLQKINESRNLVEAQKKSKHKKVTNQASAVNDMDTAQASDNVAMFALEPGTKFIMADHTDITEESIVNNVASDVPASKEPVDME
jgi:hypothetical protein